MKTILSSKTHHYVARVSIFLIAAAIIAGIIGCDGSPEGGTYNLTISSTAGGSVTIPGEGTFTCSPGMVVGLVAETDEGYRFVEWTGDVDTVVDVDAASTNITMNASYSITANFMAVGLCFIATAA
jgi:hypothetical protein